MGPHPLPLSHREEKGWSEGSEWKSTGVLTRLLAKPGDTRVRIGLDGGGRAWIDNLELRPLAEGEAIPKGIAEKTVPAVEPPAWVKALPKGIVAAWSLDERVGGLAYDWVGGRHLELTNPLWVERDGHQGLRLSPDFAEAYGTVQGGLQLSRPDAGPVDLA